MMFAPSSSCSAILIVAVGLAYALALWRLATRVADQRGIELGPCPSVALSLCGLLPPLACMWLGLHLNLAATAAVIGTVVCATVDARTGLIFDALSFTVFVVCCLLGTLGGQAIDGLSAAGLVGGMLFALHLATRRAGIGLGDVKLSAAIAPGLGLEAALIALGSAFVIGAAYAIALLATRRATRTDCLRFGPFIAAGTAIAFIAQPLLFTR